MRENKMENDFAFFWLLLLFSMTTAQIFVGFLEAYFNWISKHLIPAKPTSSNVCLAFSLFTVIPEDIRTKILEKIGSKPIKIYILFSALVGDKHQSIGVTHAMKKQLRQLQLLNSEIIELEESKLNAEIKNFTARDIIITAGLPGVKMIQQIKESLKPQEQPFTISTGHQYFSEFKEMQREHFADVVGFPKGNLTEAQIRLLQDNAVFVPLQGVPHNVTEETVREDLAKFKNPPNLIGKIPVGIILSGDAPDYSQEQRPTNLFTADDARLRARFIVNNLTECKKLPDERIQILITDGPRTSPNASSAFLEELEKLGIKKSQIWFSKFDRSNLPSAYKPILQWITSHKSLLYVPAESTSMVAESEYVSNRGGTVVAYSTSSENASHTQTNRVCFELGKIHILNAKGEHQVPESKPKYSSTSDAEKVAGEAAKAFVNHCLSRVLYERVLKEDKSVTQESTKSTFTA